MCNLAGLDLLVWSFDSILFNTSPIPAHNQEDDEEDSSQSEDDGKEHIEVEEEEQLQHPNTSIPTKYNKANHEDEDEEYLPLSGRRKNMKENTTQPPSSIHDKRYPTRERRPLGEWWKKHIIPQVSKEHANVALLDDPLSLSDAKKCGDAMKWEIAMQEEYKSLMDNATWELTPLPPNC
jgi:hypothetical protein